MLDKVQLEKDLSEVFARCIKKNDPAVNRIKKAFAEAVERAANNAMAQISTIQLKEYLAEYRKSPLCDKGDWDAGAHGFYCFIMSKLRQ